ncbi:inactive protein RESTRICTED TEV MOVEMENT 2-like [Lycium ferocissimum]|uniref:inactive protein RESTRICTED TEV MOVEMENT 2-like n=1 Tax=Lycium ferocissimum TaxID=112874 RepID=UPI002815A3BE|nr:inactive protein RESTRICTED TEV MOVEMENT 2-like [Lycium ferocissimum]
MQKMNSKGAEVATPTQIYEDFVPSSKLVKEEHSDTLHLTLPGFKTEQMRVQLTETGILKISGQRPIGQNKWQRFQKEFPVAENCDQSKISAKFENGTLHIKQPKLITSSVKKDKELAATEAENSPAAKRQKTSLRDEFSKQENADINTPAKEELKNSSTKTSEQTEAKNLAGKKLPADESSSSSSSCSESESESTDDETTGNASCLAASLKKPRKVMKMTLVALSVLGIGLYVANVMKSANEAEK